MSGVQVLWKDYAGKGTDVIFGSSSFIVEMTLSQSALFGNLSGLFAIIGWLFVNVTSLFRFATFQGKGLRRVSKK